MKTIGRLLCSLVGFLLLAVTTAAVAQPSYPSRPIRLVVAFPPGGGTDFVARLVGPKLGEQLSQQVVIDNRPGASGMIGTDLVAKSAPDGHTLLVSGVGQLVTGPLFEKVPYNPVRDFTAASLLADLYHVLVVHPSLPAKSVKELITLAKTRPGEINYASTGSGANLFLIAELFKITAGINMTHIPYKGAGPAGLSVLSGETQAMFTSITSVLQFLRSGRLVALAVTGPDRSRLLPEVPTFVESGLPEVRVAAWFVLMAPAATPREIIARLNAEIVKFGATPDYRQQLEKQGFEPLTSTPEEFSAVLKAEIEKTRKLINALGIKSR